MEAFRFLLFVRKAEILKLQSAICQKGLTIVPLKLFFDRSLVKLEIAICKGKKLYDKRKTIKERDSKRDLARELKSARM